MLIRDNVVNIERLNTKDIKQLTNKSELLLETKKTIIEKTEILITNSILSTEESNAITIQETADLIEILLSNIRNKNLNELDLVKMIEDKKRICGSYNQGFYK